MAQHRNGIASRLFDSATFAFLRMVMRSLTTNLRSSFFGTRSGEPRLPRRTTPTFRRARRQGVATPFCPVKTRRADSRSAVATEGVAPTKAMPSSSTRARVVPLRKSGHDGRSKPLATA